MPIIISANTTIDPALALGFTQAARAQTIIDGGSPYGSLFQVDTSINAALLGQLFPGRLGDGSQRPGMFIGRAQSADPDETAYVTVNDYTVGGWSISRSFNTSIQTAAFQFARARTGFEKDFLSGPDPFYFDSPINAGQAGDGLRRWIIDILYHLPTTVDAGAQVFKGIMDSVSMQAIASGSVDTVNFTDLIRQYTGVPVTLVLPAGHNLPRAEIIRRLFGEAGYPQGFNVLGPPLSDVNSLKPVDLANGDWLSLVQAIGDVVGARIVANPSGNIEAVYVDVENAPKTVQWLYDERDIVTSVNGSSVNLSIEAATEAYTSISVRGSKQVTDDSDGGAETKLFEQKSFSLFRDGKPFIQSGVTGAITSSGANDFVIGNELGEPPTLFSTTVTSITTELPSKGEAIPTTDTEISVTRSLYNNRAIRYRREETDDSIIAYFPVYVEENTGTDGGGSGQSYNYAREQLTDYSITEKFYNDNGELFQTESRVYGMYNPKACREGFVVPGQAFQGSDYGGPLVAPGASLPTRTAPRNVLDATGKYWDDGEGNMVSESRDSCILIQRKIEEIESANGYVTRIVTRDFKWVQTPGGSFTFQDGTTSSNETEVFKEVGRTEETFAQISEDEVLKITKVINNFASGQNTSVTERFNGSLTPVSAKNYILREDYDSDADFQVALAADRFKQQEISAECDSSVLEAVRPRNELTNVFVEWAENTGDLQAYCDRLIKMGRAFIFNFPVPVNSLLREGQYGHVRFRTDALKVDHDFFVMDLSHTGGENQPMLTNIRALCLTWI